jgi:hypothetical protein
MCAFTTRSSCERILYSVFERMNNHWTRHPLPLLHRTLDATPLFSFENDDVALEGFHAASRYRSRL